MNTTTREIKEMLDWMSSYGSDSSGGMTRLLYSESWLAVQQALKRKFEALGMEAEFDQVGNLFGIIRGTEAPDHIIATGSHVDTVVNGGKLDGQLGIFGGYLAVKLLLEKYGRPKKSMAVISMAEEEGSRFPYVFWGSKNLFGLVRKEEVMDLTDMNGVRFEEAMWSCGFDYPTGMPAAMEQVCTFLELHIEQGNTLEMEGHAVGVISAIAGQRRYNITLKGEANHAGTTLMRYRKDVVLAAAKMISQSIEKAGHKGDPLVLTFGRLVVRPNTVNVVPGEILFTMDCRHTDEETLHKFTEMIEEDMRAIAAEHSLEIEIDCWMDERPVPMDEEVSRIIEEVCREQGFNYRKMHSGAGHDSQIIALRIPTGMIFVPSIRGISHNPAEETKLEDLKQGIKALAGTIYKFAY